MFQIDFRVKEIKKSNQYQNWNSKQKIQEIKIKL